MYQRQPLPQVAQELGLPPESLIPYGRDKAKIDLAALTGPPQGAGRLILVSAINPTPAGEGKTTTAIGLAMGMRRQGHKVALCLREPSLGPVFGVKGGGTGGGKATLEPADDINLHFTGDIHAITSAHNLLSALIDNALHFGTPILGAPLDPRRIRWGRALDMNDRALRHVLVGLGGTTGGVPREERFDITAASEVMAILALAENLDDLQARLGRIVVGENMERQRVTAADLGAAPAMTALLRDALLPNLVQTAEGGPAIVHCGPFGNIAHGCNSVLATRMGMHYGDWAVTEAGFGLDLGGEKFLDIKARQMGVWPRCMVLVATLRALKLHGGVPLAEVGEPQLEGLLAGLAHLEKHLQTAQAFGLPVVVALNVFPSDTEAEIAQVREAASRYGAPVARCDGYAQGGAGALELADAVTHLVLAQEEAPEPRCLYPLEMTPEAKIAAIACQAYGAEGVDFAPAALTQIKNWVDQGFGNLPICMAKTQLSLSDRPGLIGRPVGFRVTVREVRLAAGAGFLVALCGEMMTMPGLPRVPAAHRVRLDADGTIRGLMQND